MKLHYFSVQISKCDYNNFGVPDIGRIIADKYIFLLNLTEFKQPENFLAKLRMGDQLNICAAQLKNGNFSVYWAQHPTKGSIIPEQNLRAKHVLSLLFSSLLAIFCLIFSIKTLFLDSKTTMQLAGLTAGVFGILLIAISSVFIPKIFRIFSPSHKKAFKVLSSINANSVQLDQPQIVSTDSIPHEKPLETLISNNSLSRISGGVENIHTVLTTEGNGKNLNFYYDFIIAINHKNYSVRTSASNNLTYKTHGLLIAKGDQLELLGIPNQDDIIGIFNTTDQTAYIIKNSKKSIIKALWILFLVLMAITLIVIGSVNVNHILETGSHWDAIDLKYFINSLDFLLFSAGITSTMLLLIYPLISFGNKQKIKLEPVANLILTQLLLEKSKHILRIII